MGPMTPERWERVKTLYDAARTRFPGDRSAFLARECDGDTDLHLERAEQQSLSSLSILKEGREYDPLRANQRSVALLHRRFGS